MISYLIDLFRSLCVGRPSKPPTAIKAEVKPLPRQMATTFYKGDNLHWLKTFADKSVHLIYFNPPFGTTQNDWDHKLDWTALFAEFDRVLRDDGNIVIHCSVPFNYTLIREAPRPPSYSWYWKKEKITNPFLAKIQPLRNTEEILVWRGRSKAAYYPQRVGDEERTFTSKGNNTTYYGATTPQKAQTVKGHYQTHFLDYKRSIDGFATRPAELIELIIKSYTKEGDVVVDPTCYKGLSGVVAKSLGRRWVGIDLHFFPSLLLECSPPSQKALNTLVNA